MNKHKHRDVIVAYLDGEAVQKYDTSTMQWEDMSSFAVLDYLPNFSTSRLYRIKPQEESGILRITRSFKFNDPSHITYTNAKDSNLKLYWVEDKLIRAEVI